MAKKELPKSKSATDDLDVSIIIVSFNTAQLLRRCLLSLTNSLALTPSLSHEIWVVDNASPDGSADIVRQEFPSIRLIANDDNRGFAAANNQALALAQGKFILLLNPDTEVRDDAIAEMYRFLQTHPKVGMVSCQLLHSDGTFQHSCFHFPTLMMTFLDHFPLNYRLTDSSLNGRYSREKYEAPFPIDHPLGACMFVRREVLDEVGIFDERFFIYCEEIDLCLRIKRAGWEIWCVPNAQVVHHVAQSTRQFRGPMLVELHRSRDELFKKHYGPIFRWCNRRLIRAGVAKDASRTRQELAQGIISAEEAEDRLKAYQTIGRM